MRVSRRGWLLAGLLGAPALAPAQSLFTPSRLVARSDSFTVLMQGKPIGAIVERLERTSAGYTLTSTQQMLGMSQVTAVRFSRSLEMQAVKQAGQARGAAMNIDVVYAKGRATGSATTPASQGVKNLRIDAAVPAGAVDDNALQALLPTLPLAVGKSFKVPVFSSGTGTTTSMTLKVAASETVTVPAGTFEAWRVEVTGGQTPVSFWISRKGPRVVKLGFVGAPMSFELVK